VTCASNGTYSTTVDLSNVPDRANVPIKVTQTDAVGNTSGPPVAALLTARRSLSSR